MKRLFVGLVLAITPVALWAIMNPLGQIELIQEGRDKVLVMKTETAVKRATRTATATPGIKASPSMTPTPSSTPTPLKTQTRS